MFGKILFILACLTIPVVWGIFVNWLFDFWMTSKKSTEDNEPIFPDYQI